MSMPSTLSLLFLALSRTCAQLVTSDTLYVVLTTDGATCASARLAPIASKSECDNAVAAINAANGWPGRGTTGQVSYSFRPSGCSSNCFSSSGSGYYCVDFNTADTSHGVEGDTRVFCSSLPLPALPPFALYQRGGDQLPPSRRGQRTARARARAKATGSRPGLRPGLGS